MTATDPGTVPADPLDALEANLIDHYRFLGALSGSTFHQGSDLVRFISGRSASFLNAVLMARFGDDMADARIADALAPVLDAGVSCRWWVGPRDTPADLGRRLAAAGLDHRDDSPAMTLDMERRDLERLIEEHPGPPGLRIERVTELETLRGFVAALTAAFGERVGAADVWFDTLAELGVGPDLPQRRYIGVLDGRAVATATLHLGGGAAGLYHIGTVPEARRRGIGAAITLAPLRDAMAEGYRLAVLQASPQGAELYRRLGFVQRCSMGLYRWR